MGVPGADDVMLNYQSTSFHDALYLRELLGLRRAPEFEAWLRRMGLTDEPGACAPPASPRAAAGPAAAAPRDDAADPSGRALADPAPR